MNRNGVPQSLRLFRSIARRLLRWYARHARPLPWRQSNDPYAIWISEIMLQQTQVQTVIPYWERWMKRFPDVGTLAKAPLPQVLKLWEGLGYYSRARNLHTAARSIVQRNLGQLPRKYEEWLELPGIGRYTAGAICSIAFNQAAPILDGNAARVLARLFALNLPIKSGPAQKKLWIWATQLIETAANLKQEPDPRCAHFNQALMELGATICLPRQPLCNECPLRINCQAFLQGCQNEIPLTTPSPAPSTRHLIGLVVRHKDRFLVRQRPEQGVNAGLWEFPNEEIEGLEKKPTDGILRRLATSSFHGLSPWTTLRFTITRFNIVLQVYRAEAHGKRSESGKWLTLRELDHLPLSAAHRRLARMLAKEAVPSKNGRHGRG